jgi:double-stranded uracil-DNA glycosylase
MTRPADVLPDMLAPDQRLWFVGTAAGPVSAARRAYYAHPGNRFWRALFEAGVTERLYAPHEYPKLARLGIGLTDICKVASGSDAAIPADAFDAEGFAAKVGRFQPEGLAFTSKTAASFWLKRPTARIPHGRVADPPRADGPVVFVLPSPSGRASTWWSIEPWREAAAFLAGAQP